MLARNILKTAGNSQQASTVTTISYIENHHTDVDVSDQRTFASVNFGISGTNKYVIIAVHVVSATADASGITSLSVGGVSATRLERSSDPISNYRYAEVEIWYAQPSVSNGSVILNFSGDRYSTQAIGVFHLTTEDITAYDTGADESSNESSVFFDINVPQGGVVLAVSQAVNQGACTWQEGTEAYDVDPQSGENISAMYMNEYSGSGTVTIDNNEASSLCAVSWA